MIILVVTDILGGCRVGRESDPLAFALAQESLVTPAVEKALEILKKEKPSPGSVSHSAPARAAVVKLSSLLAAVVRLSVCFFLSKRWIFREAVYDVFSGKTHPWYWCPVSTMF